MVNINIYIILYIILRRNKISDIIIDIFILNKKKNKIKTILCL